MTLTTLVLAACGSKEETAALFVDLQTDLVPGIEFIGVDVDVYPDVSSLDGNPSARGTTYALGNSTLPVRAAEFLTLPPGSKALRARLVDATGDVRLERIAVVDIGGNTTATLVMTRECQGVSCPGAGDDPSALACLGGRCVDPRCTPETPEFCPPAECDASTDCPAVSACAEQRCDFGVCFPTVRPLSCPAGTWCNPEQGCLPAATNRCLAPDSP